MVEEVEDEETRRIGLALPEGIDMLLVTEEEYRDTLQRGKELPSKLKKPPKNTAGITPASKKTSKTEPLVNKPKAKPKFVEPDIHECQPTSSKVRIEDLVTREQEDSQCTVYRQSHEEPYQPLEAPASNDSVRSFWDRPIPKPQYEWPYDPRMPREWNEVIASTLTQDGGNRNPSTRQHRSCVFGKRTPNSVRSSMHANAMITR